MKTNEDLNENTSEAGKKEVEFNQILPHINDDGLKKLDELGKKNDTENLKKFFGSFKELFDVDNVNAERLSKRVIDILSDFGSLIAYSKKQNEEKNPQQTQTESKEQINPSTNMKTQSQEEAKKFEVGQLVSTPFQNSFLKGTVKSIDDDKMVIEHLKKGEITIPKEKFGETVAMFPGQKFDAREISKLFPINGVDFFNLEKKDRMALMKGDETSAMKMEYMKKTGESSSLEIVNSRFKIESTKEGLKVNQITGFQDKVYNRVLTDDEKEKMKSGEIIKAQATTKDGKEFQMMMYFDKDLEAFRAKAPKTDNLEKGKILNVDLSKDELSRLNSGETLNIERKDKDGNSLNYKVSFDKDLGKLNVSKGEVGEGLKNSEKELVKKDKAQTNDLAPKVHKPKGMKI